MITEQDLREAIAECQGERNPNANTCIKLAAYYTIRDHLYPEADEPARQSGYSFAPPPVGNTVEYESDTEFGRLIHGKEPAVVWPLVDELVSDALAVVNPRLYDAFLRKIQS